MVDWHDEAAFFAWVAEQGGRRGWSLPRIAAPRQRPWSIVYEVLCDDGRRCFAKASAPQLRYESALTATLAEWEPGFVPAVLARDDERGWLILADAGRPLRELTDGAEILPLWRRFLPRFAATQRRLQQRETELLLLGIPDRRLEQLPLRLRALIEGEQAERLQADLPVAGGRDENALGEKLSVEEWQTLCQSVPKFAEECAHLAECGIAPSLHHDDFHDGNLFIQGVGHLVLADWGESALAHPFFSLRVALRYLAFRLEIAPNAAELIELADAYLAVWGEPQQLRAQLALALHLASVNRALTWAECAAMSDDEEDHCAAAAWLRRYLRGSAGPLTHPGGSFSG
ncbi:MAG: hypothetical protein OXF83_04330 [Anaerolineaceae bacterium]|nr:hypothetical protein [Anaerolineaceae bacterium]